MDLSRIHNSQFLPTHHRDFPAAIQPQLQPIRTLQLIGCSDHNVIYLVPKYRQKLKREKPRTHCGRGWDHDSSEALRGCFEYTYWQVFFDVCSDNRTSLLTLLQPTFSSVRKQSYKLKLLVFSPTTSPASAKNSRVLIEKKMAFLNGDTASIRVLNKKLRSEAKLAKLEKSETELTASVLKKDPFRALFLLPASWHLTDKDKLV